ncbi:MAG: ATP-dependent zinc metalloprotease FtsH [Anaerolineae bacterium]|nr:ATP-dependent zinc metalloprotease FtsH [Anaerolineae bacterium]MCO5191853.1 ATP-dependent zinc metalloprotease FtsH [Anaerolineae bacterium]MCO5197669.1 ATP-dependent zinc metalloprotease FtsH [Anaerolineae bacterium]MCO5206596.1 ATP-dependent zinc metalloprotease FtsH [Anaerolineae bacterium]
MEEQPRNSRPQIPVWGWILGILAIILVVQFWMRGSLNAPDKATADEVATLLTSNQVESIAMKNNVAEVTLKDGTTVAWDTDPQLSIYEELVYRGVPPETIEVFVLQTPDSSISDTLLTLAFSFGPILLIIWIFSRGFRQMQGGGGNSIFGFGRSKAKNINDGDRPTVTFEDVAGVEEAKEEVAEVVQFLREPEKFIQVGARIPRGVLMVGPPGTGKTLLARAIAGEAGTPFYHISGSEFVEMFVGVGASRVRDLFNKAKENAPSIVFVDEIDAVGRQRGAGLGGGNDEREQTLNQILVEMDGFDNETNVIIIAATNRVDVLDPALLRPGRFDRKVIVNLPDVKGRKAILTVHARGKPISKQVDFEDWARLTAGFSGADLENLVNEAAIFAARRNSVSIVPEDFQEAFDRVAIGPKKKSVVISEEDKEVLAYHEAGHAVVSFNLLNTDPVQKITIVPRGFAGGFVLPLPEETMVKSREWFEDKIAMALGGRAAEEIFFGRITTGASNDLQQSTSLARSMIMSFGMSDELGLRTYGNQSGNVFIGGNFSARDYSEEAAKQIDFEVKRILGENYERAKRIILENREQLVALVDRLLDVETLDREDFEALMNQVGAPAD